MVPTDVRLVKQLFRDEAFGAAWGRVLRLWQPLAGWTILVWAAVALVLGPASTALLGWQALRGPRSVVGNEALLVWLVTPRGAMWALLAGGLVLMGSVIRYAGVFHLVTDDLLGRHATIRRTALHLVPQIPSLFRLSVVAAAAGATLAGLGVIGLAGIRSLLVAEYDINYYLWERPPEWGRAVAAATVWIGLWAVVALFVVGRTVLAVPAYLDGHQPVRVAFRRAKERGHGHKPRLFRLLGAAAVLWLLSRLGATAAYFAGGAAVVEWIASISPSLRALVAATATYGAGLFVLDAVISIVGFSFLAVVLTQFYYEDTDLHDVVPAPRLRELPWRVMRRARPWLRPRRLVPLAAAFWLAGVVGVGLVLARIPDVEPVLVIAHRAGPPPAPENTLAALERSIAAGADHAEIDVQRTRDGVVVVVHDADLMRVAGDPRRVADVAYAEVASLVQRGGDDTPPAERRLATLDAFLTRARGRIGLTIELKYYGPDPDLARAVVETVRAHGMVDQVTVMSLDVGAVEQLARIAPEFEIGYVAAAAVGDLTRLPVRFLALSRSRATPRLLRTAAQRGVGVHVWTVNRADAMAELMERGVDGLITDDPALAVRVSREMVELAPASRLLLRFRPAWD